MTVFLMKYVDVNYINDVSILVFSCIAVGFMLACLPWLIGWFINKIMILLKG